MKIGIIGAMTGNGHISVLKALEKEFKDRDIEVDCYPDFYEKLMLSNKILSDFYNFLLSNSIDLCNKYCEFTNATRSDLSEDFYQGVKDNIIDFLLKNNYDILISVTHTINPAIIRIINELNLEKKLKFEIVITDPFVPVAVGYAVPGAYKYYCATDMVKELLLKHGVDYSKIKVFGYPINQKFHVKKKLNKEEKTILLNCGSQGNIYYYEMLKKICKKLPEININIVCVKNIILYKQICKNLKKNNLEKRVKVFSFVKNMEKLLNDSNIVITKPGANSLFEAINCKTPIIIDAVNGLIYQEKGVKEFLDEYNIGKILYNMEELIETLLYSLCPNNYEMYIKNMEKIPWSNGTVEIVNDILN